MPDLARHLAQAARNEALSQQLEVGYPEWAITALFYSALHYVEAYFYHHAGGSQPQHYVTHGTRNSGVAQRLGTLHRPYMVLYNRSRDARYDCVQFTTTDVQRLRQNELAQIKQHVLNSLPPP